MIYVNNTNRGYVVNSVQLEIKGLRKIEGASIFNLTTARDIIIPRLFRAVDFASCVYIVRNRFHSGFDGEFTDYNKYELTTHGRGCFTLGTC